MLKLSAVVVCFNEAHHLRACLESLSFADERVLVDLGSKDESRAVGESLGVRVVDHPWVPIVEHVREAAVSYASHNWVVFVDPDMVLPEGAGRVIRETISTNPKIAGVRMPWQYYFLDRPLRYTPWGGTRRTQVVCIHRERYKLGREVHTGMRPKEGFEVKRLRASPDTVIGHYWVTSLESFLEKHRRYYMMEAVKPRNEGRRGSPARSFYRLIKGFFFSYLRRRGLFEATLGLLLSVSCGFYHYNT